MMKNGKVIIVTGAGHGIGAEIARHFLAENHRVVIAEINEAHKDFALKDPSRVLFVKTDVKSESSVKKMIQQTIKHFGQIDALVNNAGMLPKKSVPLEKMALKTWNDFIATNLTATFLCAKYAIPHLRKQKGSIVNIASTRALQSEGDDEPYSASKGGLVSLTHALAIGLGPDIRVNCVSPGWIHTDQTPLRKIDHKQHPVGRVRLPTDIAPLVSFLISEQAAFITGQNFIVDGGMTVKMIYA